MFNHHITFPNISRTSQESPIVQHIYSSLLHKAYLRALYLCLIINLIASSSHAEPVQTIKLNREVLKNFKRARVHVPVDPFYNAGALIAEGVQFHELLQNQLNDEIKSNPERYLLRFVCSDGYMTTYPFASTLGGSGVIADQLISLAPQEEGVPDPSNSDSNQTSSTQRWPTRHRGKLRDHAGPYYLLWEGERFSKHRPWPYQLTSIDILPAQHLEALKPDPTDGVDTGFKLFSTHCKACHTMNLVGGAMGPELNVPQNILSYRTREQVIAFIKNPKSFRFSSLMPPSTLPDQDLELILDYLQAMAKRQVCKTLESCQHIAHTLE